MPFTAEQIEDAELAMEEWLNREDELFISLMYFPFTNKMADEFMKHGFGRRLRLIKHSMQRVFESVPMNEADPSDEALMDATAHLHTFVINVFGAIDNMAHIWCYESQLKMKNGAAIPRMQIGLTPKSSVVRESLSESFRNSLTEADNWFAYLEEYRHALAHRIPLYIPPRALDPDAQAEHARIQSSMREVLLTDRELYWNLFDQQRRLGVFDPWMIHSYGEEARPVRFHAQLINDFATVIEMGEYLLRELQQHAAGQNV